MLESAPFCLLRRRPAALLPSRHHAARDARPGRPERHRTHLESRGRRIRLMAIKKTVTTTPMSHYAPPNTGMPHPASGDEKVSKRGGYTFFSWPRFHYFGGAPQAFSQMGNKA